MILRLNILLLVMMLYMPVLTAQKAVSDDFILLHGIVMDARTFETISNVHFILNQSYGNITDGKGEFSLFLKQADTIRFTHMGYQDFIYTPGDTLKEGNIYTAGIFMQSDTLVVGEVIVIPRIPDLRVSMLTGSRELSQKERNARNNIAVSVYQGLNSGERLDNPSANYNILKRKQVFEAYEKGAIPSDRMIGINFLILPVALINLAKPAPGRPDPPRPLIRQKDVEKMKEIYRKNLEEDATPYRKQP